MWYKVGVMKQSITKHQHQHQKPDKPYQRSYFLLETCVCFAFSSPWSTVKIRDSLWFGQANLYSALTYFFSYSWIPQNSAFAGLSHMLIFTQSQIRLYFSSELFCLFIFPTHSYLYSSDFLLPVLTANCFQFVFLIQHDSTEKHNSALLPFCYTRAPANWPWRLVMPLLLRPKSHCKHVIEQPEVLSLVNNISMCSVGNNHNHTTCYFLFFPDTPWRCRVSLQVSLIDVPGEHYTIPTGDKAH